MQKYNNNGICLYDASRKENNNPTHLQNLVNPNILVFLDANHMLIVHANNLLGNMAPDFWVFKELQLNVELNTTR